MGIRFFSTKNRPSHLGPYPLEQLPRQSAPADLSAVPPMQSVGFRRPEAPESIVNAMGEYQAMLDAIRNGLVNMQRSEIPSDPQERADHLKAFGYFNDAAMVGVCALSDEMMLAEPIDNPDIARLAHDLKTRQTKTLASGIDMIMADLKESMEAPPTTIAGHTHAMVYLYDNPRAPAAQEKGAAWLQDALAQRGADVQHGGPPVKKPAGQPGQQGDKHDSQCRGDSQVPGQRCAAIGRVGEPGRQQKCHAGGHGLGWVR